MLSNYFLFATVIVQIILTIFIILFTVEVGITFLRRTAPQLPSQRKLRNAMIAEIRKHYPNAQTAIDIGSGWGGMARRIGKEFPKMRVLGVELMPLAFSFSWVSRLILGPRNVRFVRGNVISWLGTHHEQWATNNESRYDIAVCYSGTALMKALSPMAGRFRVILSLDFPLPGHKPTRTVKLHKDRLGQHTLYVYEIKRTKPR